MIYVGQFMTPYHMNGFFFSSIFAFCCFALGGLSYLQVFVLFLPEDGHF